MRIQRLLILILALSLPLSALAEEQCPLIVNLGSSESPDLRTVAQVVSPEGYAPLEDASPTGSEPEYYLVPNDAESPVRFLYYTTGCGDSRALAEAARENYALFYDEFDSGEIAEITLSGRACLCLAYTCAYPGRDGATPVYEQSAICYFPAGENAFVACILSLSFDSPDDYLSEAAFAESLEQMASAVQWME